MFYKFDMIYEAKVIKTKEIPGAVAAGERWPLKYLVHYQGWNARYDEWIRRARIAENLSWSKDRAAAHASTAKHSGTGKLTRGQWPYRLAS